MIKCTNTNVLWQWEKGVELKVGSIILNNALKRSTRWAICKVVGNESILQPGDRLLLSARPTSFTLEIGDEIMQNGSDAATIAYERDGELYATAGTIIYEIVKGIDEEEKTESGIIVHRSVNNRLNEVRECLVHAAGPKAEVKKGDTILIGFDKDNYTFEWKGKKLHNCGSEAVICYYRGQRDA
jgi:co-chaperonin GroES (HSP10)